MEITLTNFVICVLTASAVIVLSVALISRWLHQRQERRSLANRMICRLCLYAFEDTTHARTVDCPVCGACNEKGRSRKLG
jgi:uncharacterized paraquat-inducible protein A